ncbi:hypothetical protein K440DRAFT_612944 [Wilcoxina mikolae CBS 423.85]|nr:hypothetical protein K440DRAFT_612944 [Wilcoxina mikolae CBS 423.85]
MGMAFLVALVGYSLVLIVMSFVVAWFFAVITGLAVGEFIFARLHVGRNGRDNRH